MPSGRPAGGRIPLGAGHVGTSESTMLHPVAISAIVLFTSRLAVAGGLVALVATLLRRR